MALTRLIGTCFVAVVLAAVGCGGSNESSDQDAVADVMSSLDEASRDGNGAKICSDLFTPKLANSVKSSADSGDCAAEVKAKLFSPDSKIEVDDISVPDDANATAVVTEGNGNVSRVFLVKQGGEWRIRSVVPA
jgi:hypothetical protein